MQRLLPLRDVHGRHHQAEHSAVGVLEPEVGDGADTAPGLLRCPVAPDEPVQHGLPGVEDPLRHDGLGFRGLERAHLGEEPAHQSFPGHGTRRATGGARAHHAQPVVEDVQCHRRMREQRRQDRRVQPPHALTGREHLPDHGCAVQHRLDQHPGWVRETFAPRPVAAGPGGPPMSAVTDRPTASPADHPNTSSAAGPHSTTRPLSSTSASTSPLGMRMHLRPPCLPVPSRRQACPPDSYTDRLSRSARTSAWSRRPRVGEGGCDEGAWRVSPRRASPRSARRSHRPWRSSCPRSRGVAPHRDERDVPGGGHHADLAALHRVLP